MKTYKIITLASLVAFLIVGLMLSAYQFNKKIRKNGFNRHFISKAIVVETRRDLGFETYYLSGLTAKAIYLGNYGSRKQLLMLDPRLEHAKNIILNFPTDKKIAWQALQMQVDSPFVYASEGITPSMTTFNLTGGYLKYHIWTLATGFDKSAPKSPSSAIFRIMDPARNQRVLKYVDMLSGPPKEFILPKQGDGAFSVDGMLYFSSQQHSFVYLYYYRNGLLKLDTNLKVEYVASTIDTIQHAQIQVAAFKKSGKTITALLSRPPLLVNRLSCVSDNRVFILSALKSDKEITSDFEESDVIDVYGLDQGKYLYSWSFVRNDGKAIKDFKVFGRQLVALSGSCLLTYKLPL